MTMLIQSLVSFLLGPLVAILGGRVPSMLPVIDGFVLISLSGLVMLEVIPHAMEEIGMWALESGSQLVASPSRDPEEPAAHLSDSLALLPSGPDAVHRLRLHRIRAALRPVTTLANGGPR